jgi:hypothetical protein
MVPFGVASHRKCENVETGYIACPPCPDPPNSAVDRTAEASRLTVTARFHSPPTSCTSLFPICAMAGSHSSRMIPVTSRKEPWTMMHAAAGNASGIQLARTRSDKSVAPLPTSLKEELKKISSSASNWPVCLCRAARGGRKSSRANRRFTPSGTYVCLSCSNRGFVIRHDPSQRRSANPPPAGSLTSSRAIPSGRSSPLVCKAAPAGRRECLR